MSVFPTPLQIVLHLSTLGASIWAAIATAIGGGELGADPDRSVGLERSATGAGASLWGGPRLPSDTDGQIALVVVLPENAAAHRLAVHSLRNLRRRVTDGSIVVFDSDVAGDRRGLEGRGLEVDGDEELARAEFEVRLGHGGGGLAALLDAERRVLAVGDLDLGMFEHFELLVDRGLAPLPGRVHGVSPELRESDTRTANPLVRNSLGSNVSEGLVLAPDEIADLAHRDSAGIEAAFDEMFEALATRPIARLEISLDYARVFPDLAGESKLRREVRRRQRADLQSPIVQLAVTEIALLGGDLRLAQRAGYAYLDCVKGLTGRATDLIRLLEQSPQATDFDRLMEHALSVGLLHEPDEPKLLRQQFDFHLRVRADFEAARQSGLRLVEAYGADSRGLNALAWSLLTEERYRGRFNGLAMSAARAMEKDPDWRVSWRLDTYALAAFENGLHELAVELQREAVQTCGSGSRPSYEERLRRYERSL